MTSTWTETYPVRSYSVGPGGLLTLPTLVNFLQDAAGAHARELNVSAEQLVKQRLTSFLARLHVVVDERPAWRDKVSVETWPSGHDGLYATREFMVHGPAGLLARGTSTWLLVHLDRRRPVRLPDFIRDLPIPDRPHPQPESPDRLPAVGELEFVHVERARRDDLDVNAHVNNVSYLTWVLETLAQADVAVLPDEFHLLFRAEAVYGGRIRIEPARSGADGGFAHRLTREADDGELALALTNERGV